MSAKGPEVHPEPGERVAPRLCAKAALLVNKAARRFWNLMMETAWVAIPEPKRPHRDTLAWRLYDHCWLRAIQADERCRDREGRLL